MDDSPRRVIGERSDTYDEPPVARKSPWKSIAFAAVGVAAAVGLVLLVAGGDSGPSMPESAGEQSHTFDDVHFLSFDDQTDLDLLQFHSRKTVDVGQRAYIEAKGSFKLIEIRAKDHWVFMWHNFDDNQGVQGLVNKVHVTYDLPGRPPRSTSDYWSQPPSGGSTSTEPITLDQLLKKGFESQHTFGAATQGRVFVATVRHPVDAASLSRARAFVDEAIKRPRGVHHAAGILAIMRATGEADDAWLAWLRKLAGADIDELSKETQPDADSFVRSTINEICRRARAEAAVTLAILTDFAEIEPLVTCLKQIRPHGNVCMTMLLDTMRQKELDTAMVERIKKIEAKLDKMERHPLTMVMREKASLAAFEAFLSADPPAPGTPVELDPTIIELINTLKREPPDSPRVRHIKPKLHQVLAKEPSTSPRLKLLFDIMLGLDEEAYIALALDHLEKAPLPWPGWTDEVIDVMQRRVRGFYNSHRPLINWKQALTPHRSRFESLAEKLPHSMYDAKGKIGLIVSQFNSTIGRNIQDQAANDRRTFQASQLEAETQMRYMIYARDIEGLTLRLSDGYRPSSKPLRSNVEPLLFAAARVGSVEMIRMLIDAGADPLAEMQFRGPMLMPFDVALHQGHLDAAGALLNPMIERVVSTHDKAQFELLIAIRNGDVEQVRRFARSTYSTRNEARVLRYALLLGHEPVTTVLFDSNASDVTRYSPALFHAAIAHRRQDQLNWLLKRGCDPSRMATVSMNPQPQTVNAMVSAILAENVEALQLLHDKNVAPPVNRNRGAAFAKLANHILAEALALNRPRAAQWALDQGADIRFAKEGAVDAINLARGANGPTHLWVIEHGYHEGKSLPNQPWTQRVIEGGSVVELAKEVPQFAEYLAMYPQNVDRLKALLDSGFDMESAVRPGPKGNEATLLFIAAMNDNEPAVRLLLQRGANPNAQGPGSTVFGVSLALHPGSPVNQMLQKAGATYPEK